MCCRQAWDQQAGWDYDSGAAGYDSGGAGYASPDGYAADAGAVVPAGDEWGTAGDGTGAEYVPDPSAMAEWAGTWQQHVDESGACPCELCCYLRRGFDRLVDGLFVSGNPYWYDEATGMTQWEDPYNATSYNAPETVPADVRVDNDGGGSATVQSL